MRLALYIGAEQGTVTQDVNQARYAAGQLLNFIDGALVEKHLRGAANLQAVFDIGICLIPADRVEVIACGDTLGELPHIVTCQQGTQFRLTNQNDLQQFLRGCFQVCEQAHLLQHIGTQVLRLVDNQYRTTTACIGIQQVTVQHIRQ